MLQGSAGQIIEIRDLCAVYSGYTLPESCVIGIGIGCVWFALRLSTDIAHAGTDWDWWEATAALRRRGAAGSAAFDIDGDGGHGGTCKIGC